MDIPFKSSLKLLREKSRRNHHFLGNQSMVDLSFGVNRIHYVMIYLWNLPLRVYLNSALGIKFYDLDLSSRLMIDLLYKKKRLMIEYYVE